MLKYNFLIGLVMLVLFMGLFNENKTITNNASNEMDSNKYPIIEVNKNIKAKLKINGILDVSVAQSEDNKYYLSHNIDGKEDVKGAIFLDYRNNLTDKKILIYGHNSKTINTDFHILEKYLDYNFYNEHQYIILENKNLSFKYQIFSVIIVTKDYQHVNLKFNDVTWKNHLDWLKANSVYETGVNIISNDDILVLQTCFYNPDNSYLIIVAKKIK